MTSDDRSVAAPTRRVRIAQALALTALVAAAVGALGPAERVRTTYAWPPKDLPTGAPRNAWYTPLVLVRHRPEAISARIPCSLPALPGAGSPVRVLGTARYPERTEGLAVTKRGDQLVLAIGETTLDRVRLRPARAGPGECAYDLRLGAGAWSIKGGPGQLKRGGALETLPKVTGLFSELDLRSSTPPSIEVTTAVHATRTTTRQGVAWTLAVLAAITALLLVSVERKPRPRSGTRRALRAAKAHSHPVDAVVGVSLLGWWVIAPAFFDDGWIAAREQMFASSRGFSIYYNTLATNMPLDYWLEWANHWLAQATSALLVLRLPTLACLATTWVLCRWIFARVRASSSGGSAIALWALACGFLISAIAWGMTLRPEPFTGLLVVAIIACVVRFLERGTVASVAAGAVLIPLALTAHPAGVVSLAAVLVAAPTLVRWAWPHLADATAIVAGACALLTTLLLVGSDLEQRLLDARTTATYTGFAPEWRDETARYVLLSYDLYGTPLRRASVVLILLAVLAFVLRRRQRNGWSLLDFPASVLAVGLLLLIATPSKWPWHFGTLIGIGAVAVATETEYLRRAATLSRRWRALPFLAVGAAAIVGAWSWRTRAHWNPVDLRTLDWRPALENDLPLSQLAGALPVALLAVALLVALARGRRGQLHAVPWRVASWTAPVLAVPVLVFTAATLVVDSAKTSSWTLARQNIETIVGDPGCGLAEDLFVSVRSSARALSTSGVHRSAPVPGWVPRAPVAALPRFALGPAAEGSTTSPWFTLPTRRRVGLFVAGFPAPSDRVWIDWGVRHRGRVEELRSDEFTTVRGGLSQDAPWRFFAAGDLPAPAPGATLVRVTFRTDVLPGSAVAVTAPVTYVNRRLAPEMSRAGSRTLVYPELLPYFPCTQLPVLRDGVVEVPQQVVTTDNGFSVLSGDVSSPFLGLLDLYELERVPLADTKNQPRSVLVFGVNRLIPGIELAPPVRMTFTS